MTGKKMFYLLGAAIILVIAYFGWKMMSRSSYESAEFTMVQSDGPFEIREYPDLMLVTTDMQFQSQGDDGSFMRLFGYISGGNKEEQKVAMTTPVFMERESEQAQGQMGFVIPKEVTEQGIPDPSNDNVQIRQRTGGRFAVIRFSGRMNPEVNASNEEKLRQWISENGLVGQGDAEFAGYDPPWTPGPWRRNEILIRLQSGN